MEFEAHPFSLSVLTDRVYSLLVQRARDKGVGLNLSVAEALQGYYLGDSTRIHQVLLNLMGNAVKFTEQGSAGISVTSIDGGLRFEVSDTGIGIAPDDQKRLFAEFSQVDASTTRRFGGTGLGLAISKRLVEGMGGRIGVDSTPGSGSRFWFELPLERTAEPPVAELLAGAEPVETTYAATRVLLVEDNMINQKLALTLLAKAGLDVELAENGLQAVVAASHEPFTLILMDMQMPEIDGLEATRRIRAGGGPNAQTPIVALTANAMPSDRENCRAAGMNDFLSKPFRRQDLADCLARWLGKDKSPLLPG